MGLRDAGHGTMSPLQKESAKIGNIWIGWEKCAKNVSKRILQQIIQIIIGRDNGSFLYNVCFEKSVRINCDREDPLNLKFISIFGIIILKSILIFGSTTLLHHPFCAAAVIRQPYNPAHVGLSHVYGICISETR